MKLEKQFRKVVAAMVLVALVGCAQPADTGSGTLETQASAVQQTPESAAQQSVYQEEDNMQEIEIQIGEKTFMASLYDNETARAFAALLPLQVTMYELNGNEKYANLAQRLPTAERTPDSIRTGDLMLFGSDCLVLFYEDFSTSYRYTPVGRLEAPEKLAQTLGTGNVTVTFAAVTK